jgi:DNA-binding helix-hairpin-helix protein with protein kinase domain
MHQLLKLGASVFTENSKCACVIRKFLGDGTQGEVYLADLAGSEMAVKWYFPHYLQIDPLLRDRLGRATRTSAPSEKFLWPIELVSASDVEGFGYVMPYREPRFKSINDLMRRRVEPTFRALATAGFELAHSYQQLHAKGLCYRDINFENVMFDPTDGDIRVCDNDNVDVNGAEGAINGTPSFMAPEIVRGEAMPTTKTDLYSLAVLLFYMFMVHHPLEGKKETEIRCLDALARTKLYGSNPVFIYDPQDQSNRPVPGLQDNAITFWKIYPNFLQDLFTRAFTNGIKDPDNGRVVEHEWRAAMIQLRDSIIYCPRCQVENFYDAGALKESGGKPMQCWHCAADVLFPPRIRLGRSVVMLNHDTQLFPHHVDGGKFDFSKPVAEVSRHPKNPNVWGLRNISPAPWVATMPDASMRQVEAGKSIALAIGCRINFGNIEGEIRL